MPTSKDAASPSRRGAYPPGSPLGCRRLRTGAGLLTSCPSPTPLGLGLGPTNPTRINLPSETSGFRWGRFSRPFSLLMPAFSLRTAPRALAGLRFDADADAPLPSHVMAAAASVPDLAPLHCRRGGTRPVSYYALFQGWLLLSQPPGCLRAPTSFPTQSGLRDLSWRSGLFPSRRWSLAPTVSLPALTSAGIGGLIGFGKLAPPSPVRALPPAPAAEAVPKDISGRTSYLRVRLAFHPYPQLIRWFCNTNQFGPPRGLTRASPWPWVAHPVSGLPRATPIALFGLAFAPAPGRSTP
jgi:hypothetical protein